MSGLTVEKSKQSVFEKLQPWLVVFSAALFFFFEFINMNSFDAFNDALRQAFKVDALAISNMSAMYFYANVLFLIPAGLLLDRFSTKKLLMTAMTVCIISNFVFAHSDSFLVAKLCRFVTGMGSTLCLLSCALLTSRWFPPRHAALVMGLVVTMAMLGGVVAQQIVGLTPILGDWRHVIAAISGLGILFLIIIALFVKNFPREVARLQQESQEKLHMAGFWRSFGLALSNPQNWIGGIYSNLLALPVIVLGALWGKDYLMTVHGLSADQAANVTSMIFIGTLIGSPVMGWISDQIKRRRMPMVLGAIFTCLTMIVILYNRHLSYSELMTGFFLLGLLSGSQVITFAVVMEVNPRHVTASSESLSATIIMSCGAIFQPLFGYIMHEYWDGKISNGIPVYNLASFHHAMLILPIAFAVSIVMAMLIKETFCQVQNP